MLDVLRWSLALVMVSIGLTHFVWPKAFMRIMPKWLPAHRALVLISGGCEVLGGLGLLVPAAQTYAAWGLVALYVAVFPANVNMAIHRIPLGRTPVPTWALWARLPLQLAFIGWAWLFT